MMRIDKLVAGIADSGDLGSALRKELEEGISPITERVDKLEKIAFSFQIMFGGVFRLLIYGTVFIGPKQRCIHSLNLPENTDLSLIKVTRKRRIQWCNEISNITFKTM
jgi:hypothetical protein